MLCYLGSGVRRYGDKPSKLHARPYWEFQAVLDGKISMHLDHGSGPLSNQRLWLTAPGHRHGWTAKRGAKARVAVFHFLSIPELLKQRFRKMNCLQISLTREQCLRLRSLSESLASVWQSPRPDMLLRHEHALLELSLIVSASENASQPNNDTHSRQRVNAALNWFHLHMQHNPSLDDVASAAGVSPAHLRRLFHEVMESSPKKVFDQLRFQRAIHLMTDHETKLETISAECGFQSASAFSRAFKQKFGCSPDQWRGNATKSA